MLRLAKNIFLSFFIVLSTLDTYLYCSKPLRLITNKKGIQSDLIPLSPLRMSCFAPKQGTLHKSYRLPTRLLKPPIARSAVISTGPTPTYDPILIRICVCHLRTSLTKPF